MQPMLMAREEEGVFCVYNTVVCVCVCVCVIVHTWTSNTGHTATKIFEPSQLLAAAITLLALPQVHNHVSLPSLLSSLPPSTTGHQVTATCLSASMSPTPLIAITARGGAGNTSTRTRRGMGTTPLQSRAYPVRAFSVSFHPRA